MQINELQAMTVLQLRKLAKDNKVKLSAGIDKDGIVKRIAEATLDGDTAPVELAAAPEASGSAAAKPAAPKKRAVKKAASEAVQTSLDELTAAAQTAALQDAPAVPATAPSARQAEPVGAPESLQEAPLAADVTSIQPAFRHWNASKPEESESRYPIYRQAWQARSAAPQRDNAPRPAWQPQRPAGNANRFGPQNAMPPVQPQAGPEESLDKRQAPQQYSAYPEQASRAPEAAPKLDGYRLGYRAAPQRPSYSSRDGGYQQNNYRQNSYGGSGGGYRPAGYRPSQPYNNGGYAPQSPAYPPRSADNRFNDSVYRMARDPQFEEQAENGQLPDLLKVTEGEPVSGILEILPDGYGFLRGSSLLPGKKDIYVSVAQIRRFDLRTGDLVAGKARAQRESDKYAALLVVEKVNGRDAEESPERLSFEQMIPVYPNKRIALESAQTDGNMVIRLVDLIAPIGFGQRAMIVAPPQSDGLMILRDISRAIKANDQDAEVLMLLIDVAPEDVTEIRDTANGEVFASTFADAPEMQTRVSETMLERAQRLVENGRNVVILLDSLTKLTRAYQGLLSQGGRPMNNTVTPAALVRPKRFFGAARNTREGGSLTVIATINVETGSRVDDIIFEEFKGTANMELFLLSPVEGDPIQPMIDLQRSGTKKDDMLLDDQRKEGLRAIRKVLGSTTNGEAVVQLIDMMKKTKCNEDLLSRLQDWVALWEKSGYLKR